MKRCPTCSRVEADDTLAYCRADGTPLIPGSGAVSAEAGTVRFASAAQSSEIETSILPHTSTPAINRTTGPTTALPAAQSEASTRELSKPTRRGLVIASLAFLVILLVGAGYLYFSRSHNRQIESIAVMPFVNESGNQDIEYLSDGMAETLIGSLSQLPNLNVKARSSQNL